MILISLIMFLDDGFWLLMMFFVRCDQEERWHMFRGSTLYASNILMDPWFLGGARYYSHFYMFI